MLLSYARFSPTTWRRSRSSSTGTLTTGSHDPPASGDLQRNCVTDHRPFDRPILALGMPRSGTTWLGKILDSHPQTLYRHEPDTWRRLDTVPLFASPARRADLCPVLREFIASLPDMLADRVCGKRPLFPKSYATPLAVRLYAARSLVHKALGRAGLSTADPVPPQPDWFGEPFHGGNSNNRPSIHLLSRPAKPWRRMTASGPEPRTRHRFRRTSDVR